ncbi:MAG: hypothetical protein ACI9AT_001252 [Ulvibacter sp.]|jgi:hypothetical protein
MLDFREISVSQNKIEPHKITKPIQLLAAWLTGLSIIDIAFLTAASQITSPAWAPGLLVVAAVVNVPIFVLSIFLLQTKFRPEMEEDSYYSDYLNKKADRHSHDKLKSPSVSVEDKISELSRRISEVAKDNPANFDEQVRDLISEEKVDELVGIVGNSRLLSELYLKPERWNAVVNRWKNDIGLSKDLDLCVRHQVIEMKDEKPESARLTGLGRQVAEAAQESEDLFAQEIDTSFYEF